MKFVMVEKVALWLIHHAVFLFVLFCISVGAAYQFVNNKDSHTLSMSARVISQFAAVLVVGIGAGYALETLKWNAYLVSFLGVMSGIGADKLLRLSMNMYNDSTDLTDFFKRFWSTWNAMKNDKPD